MKLPIMETAALENVIRIQGNSEESAAEIIDVNIKTNLTLSNTNNKGSKFIQKSIFVLILFFTGTFTAVLFNIKKELQALKLQEQCMETKIAILMTKYEKINSNINRVRTNMNNNRYYQHSTTSIKSEMKFSQNDRNIEKYEILNSDSFASSRHARDDGDNLPIRGADRYPLNFIKTNETSFENDENGTEDDEYLINDFTEDNESKNFNRFARTILNITAEDEMVDFQSVGKNVTDNRLNFNLSEEEINEMVNDDNNDNDGNIDLWNEPRTGRIRRDDERRGKIRTKKKRRPNRSRRRLGPLVATFIGGYPEQHITDTGSIGPWVVKRGRNITHYDLQRFHLVDNKKAIEITVNGLYMISTQISYFGRHTNYSYWVIINSEGSSVTQKVTKCSTVSSVAENEVSCGTNVVLFLRRGDRLKIQQQERDRWINLREGYSYIQLVQLSNESERGEHLRLEP